MFKSLQSLDAIDTEVLLSVEQFNDAVKDCFTLIHKCISGDLRVPDFASLVAAIKEVYTLVEPNEGGANAEYIPQLAEVDPDQFAISLTTTDGQHFSIGDHSTQFCVQSCSKPISYLIGLEEFGSKYVHKHVGTEPSGHSFNEMILKAVPTADDPNHAIPHNPCINAGAILMVSMVYPEVKRKHRLDRVLDVWRVLSSGVTGADGAIGYDDATYKSESATADRNWCLGYMMKERGAFPDCFKGLDTTLELYFQICSILSTTASMSTMAACLANGGLNPFTGEKVFSASHVRHVLPIMLMNGMYDFSGQWAYDIGVPAKSGVGGCVFLVIPNVCGIAIWSPRLDDIGNSVRAVAAAAELTKRYAFHNFEVFAGNNATKIDPTVPKGESKQETLAELLFAASQGDWHALERQHNAGVDLFESDYDSRTALHLAASEGECTHAYFSRLAVFVRRCMVARLNCWAPLTPLLIRPHPPLPLPLHPPSRAHCGGTVSDQARCRQGRESTFCKRQVGRNTVERCYEQWAPSLRSVADGCKG